MEVIRGHLGSPLSGGCPLFGGSAIGGSTVYSSVQYIYTAALLTLGAYRRDGYSSCLVCLSVCMYVCPNMLFWQYAQLKV